LANRQIAGFSLIELLMVLAVLGLLAAIAIPQFVSYKAKGVDSQMKSDLKNAALAMENYFAEKLMYPTTVATLATAGYTQTTGVTIIINVTSNTTYTLTASMPNGTQPSFTLNSTTGLIN
jgi:type IV pilus assembly protein PilA